MFKILLEAKEKKEIQNPSTSSYYGIGDFVDASSGLEGGTFDPGTLQDDPGYETIIKKGENTLRSYIAQKCNSDQNSRIVDDATRFFGLLLLYIGAFLRKKRFTENLTSELAKYIDNNTDLTHAMVKNIDGYEDGKGHMILLRLLLKLLYISVLTYILFDSRIIQKQSGCFFVNTLKKLRNILGQENSFSIVLDVDEKTYGKQDICEPHFLERLRR